MQTATHHTQKLTSDGKANAFDGGISAIQVQDKGTVMACYVLTFYGQILHVYSTEIPDEKKQKEHKINYPRKITGPCWYKYDFL